MEDMKVLPDHEVLYLNVLASGHSFGASSYHVLTMCDGIRMQVLRLYDTMIEKTLLDNLGSEVKLCFIYLVLSLLKKIKGSVLDMDAAPIVQNLAIRLK